MTESDTKPSLRDLLARAVAEKGEDYVYPEEEKDGVGCHYFYEGRPSCIIGHVLSYLGMTEGPEGSGAIFALRRLGFSPAEEYAAVAAQESQDAGRTWGDALAAYDTVWAAQA